MGDPFEHRYGRGENPSRPISLVRGVGIYSPYYFRNSHHYVYYENGQAQHFYTSTPITKGSLGLLKWGYRLGLVFYPILMLLFFGLIALIIKVMGFHPIILIFVVLGLVMGGVCVFLLRFLHSRYKKDSRAFFLPYADKVYQQTACPRCGGVSVYGMHNACPHCGNVMPPTAGPVYLN
ncbi:MAG: hypothetical protein IKH46_12390 [Lachnospiraceae bacterium]|nr:hypothetical protein [Lachnospiraceae bacterium]